MSLKRKKHWKHGITGAGYVEPNEKGWYECPECNSEFKTRNGLGQHISYRHQGIKTEFYQNRIQWNTGLTKETDERVARHSKLVSATANNIIQSGGKWGNGGGFSKEYLEYISIEQSINNRGKFCKWFEVSGVKLQGTWERDFALKLNEFNIDWCVNRTKDKIWPYINNGKQSHYCPDFYIPEIDTFVEIKGYWWREDKKKMQLISEQYPERHLVILTKLNFKSVLNQTDRKYILDMLVQMERYF